MIKFIGKYVGELYCKVFNEIYGLSTVSLRYFNVYGPRQNPHGEAGVVAIFSRKLLNGQASVINGDGKQTRDYVFVRDVVEANIKALESKFIGAVNIGTGKETNAIYCIKEIE